MAVWSLILIKSLFFTVVLIEWIALFSVQAVPFSRTDAIPIRWAWIPIVSLMIKVDRELSSHASAS